MPFTGVIGDAVQTRGEVTFEWKLGDFFSLPDRVGDFYHSPAFKFADSVWLLKLYLNGKSRDSAAWVSLFLVREAAVPPISIYFTFGIKGSNGVKVKQEICREFSTVESSWGFRCCWSRSELKSALFPDNLLTIMCELRSNAVRAPAEKNFKKSLLSMLEDGEDSDVVIEVQGKEFPAHKCILRARSPVFRSMFCHDMVEKRSNVVTIDDCDPETFQDLLVHIYSGSCDHISMKNVSSLFVASDKYDVGDLKEACAEFMSRNITIDCFCDFITLALKHEDKELMDRTTEFFCDNSVDIAKTAQWLTFLKENSIAANELFIKAMSK